MNIWAHKTINVPLVCILDLLAIINVYQLFLTFHFLCVWRSEDSLQELVPLLYHVGLRNQTQAMRPMAGRPLVLGAFATWATLLAQLCFNDTPSPWEGCISDIYSIAPGSLARTRRIKHSPKDEPKFHQTKIFDGTVGLMNWVGGILINGHFFSGLFLLELYGAHYQKITINIFHSLIPPWGCGM